MLLHSPKEILTVSPEGNTQTQASPIPKTLAPTLVLGRPFANATKSFPKNTAKSAPGQPTKGHSRSKFTGMEIRNLKESHDDTTIKKALLDLIPRGSYLYGADESVFPVPDQCRQA